MVALRSRLVTVGGAIIPWRPTVAKAWWSMVEMDAHPVSMWCIHGKEWPWNPETQLFTSPHKGVEDADAGAIPCGDGTTYASKKAWKANRGRGMRNYFRHFILVAVAVFVCLTGCSGMSEAPPKQEQRPAVVVTPISRVVDIKDGRFMVETHTVGTIVPIPPGSYTTDGVGRGGMTGICAWGKWTGSRFDGAGYADGRTTVEVTAGQQLEVRGGCTWKQDSW